MTAPHRPFARSLVTGRLNRDQQLRNSRQWPGPVTDTCEQLPDANQAPAATTLANTYREWLTAA